MTIRSVQAGRRRTRSLAFFIALALVAFVLAACNGSQLAVNPIQPETVTEAPPAEAPNPAPDAAQAKPAAPVLMENLTRSGEAGAVTIDITPLNLADSDVAALDFEVVMNTHSVELGVDLTRLAVLKIGATEITAQAWQAPAGGGHHVEGTLSFPARDAEGKPLLAGAEGFSIIIRDLADVSERIFTWNLGQTGDAMPVEAADSDLMAAGSAISSAMPMTGTMPGGMMAQGMQGMMDMLANMQSMMASMEGMSPGENEAMMATMVGMMGMMQGMMGAMSQEDHAQMMPQMMGMMAEMMSMMQGLSPSAQGQMMPQMMSMMANMMGMMESGGHGTGMAQDMEGMAGHSEAIPAAGVPDATEQVGGQPLAFKLEDGVKVFELTARPVRWTILDMEEARVVVTAWTYNGTVPGPTIRVTEGETVRIILTNELPEPTSIHWHGIPLPNAMDGVPPVTQGAIMPGETFVYEFVAPPAGSFMYHSHVDTDKQIMVGLYAPFIVDPREPEANSPAVDVMWMLSEWRVGADGETYPAMPMAGAEPNYFTINGKAFPNTEPIVVKVGDRVRIRMAGIGQFTHPMHLHGINFKIVAYDGVPLPPAQQIVRNTVPVNPGELVDIEFVADNAGTWLFHCHVLHHVTNDGAEPGGLVALIEVIE